VDLRDAVKSLTDGRGADVVYDPVGGDLGEAAFRATAYAARILVVGFASGGVPVFPANIVLVKNISVLGYVWGSYLRTDPDVITRSMNQLLEWAGSGTLKPAAPQTMRLDQATAALMAHAERRVTGKIVLTTD
jgi:NADPH2:quinone reductase